MQSVHINKKMMIYARQMATRLGCNTAVSDSTIVNVALKFFADFVIDHDETVKMPYTTKDILRLQLSHPGKTFFISASSGEIKESKPSK